MINIVNRFLGNNIIAHCANARYPDRITSHSGEDLPVSDGGIVLSRNPEDKYLIFEPGITAVEIDRDLGSGFYNASVSANMDLVRDIRRARRVIQDVKPDYGHFEQQFSDVMRFIQKDTDFNDPFNPVLKQFVQDFVSLSTEYRDFSKRLCEKVGDFLYQKPKSFFYDRMMILPYVQGSYGHIDNRKDADPFIRALVPYVGEATILADARVDFKDAERLLKGRISSVFSDQEKYNTYQQKKPGNITFIKPFSTVWPRLSIGDDFNNLSVRDIKIISLVENASVHLSPEYRDDGEMRSLAVYDF